MDTIRATTNTFEQYKSRSFGEGPDKNTQSGQQIAVKGFSEKRWVKPESPVTKETTSVPDCVMPSGSHQMPNQPVLEGKVAHGEAVDEVQGKVSDTFTPREAAEQCRNTIEHLISVLGYKKILTGNSLSDRRNKVIGIFIDFILYQEGLVNDRCFTVENSLDKYVVGKTISQARVEEIKSFLNAMFTERAEQEERKDNNQLRYNLPLMLTDYLNKKENVLDDVTPRIVRCFLIDYKFTYQKLIANVFPFVKNLLAGSCLFSELGVIFNFTVKFRQEMIDSIASVDKGIRSIVDKNFLTSSLRMNNNNMRECFNREVMDVIFFERCDAILNTLFYGCPVPTDSPSESLKRMKLEASAGTSDSLMTPSSLGSVDVNFQKSCGGEPPEPLNLKFGEELEYNTDEKKARDYTKRDEPCAVIFKYRAREKGMTHFGVGDYGLTEDFTVKPGYDAGWFEINCTPYHSDDQHAEICLKKVIEVVDSMCADELITDSSGHKHVDVLSATLGDTGVILAMDVEIQKNPFLLRAFGNSKLITEKNEAIWYKTFADYNPDVKPFAVKRLNFLIDQYNKKMRESDSDMVSRKGGTDAEKIDRLEQFAHFYSQFIHMTTIQHAFGSVSNDFMEKYMAMSLLHITGASKVAQLSTLEFRFFRCPKTVQEIKLINQFLQAWFHYIHQCIKDEIPLEPVPEDIKASKDYTAEEVQVKTIDYLRKLGLNPDNYRCFWGEVCDTPSAEV
ncbi:hypothetical protein [Candidatus Sororendozoicomonas aggregata]|uniref:hypothetical protein n=1 Tax=Candidatus Sororendozoicomonas aggregata TaxID=3073239 RepID=UPI002ECFC1DE